MEPIDPQELTTVTGGFAFLAALPGILSGVTGLVNAFKGNGSAPQAAPAQPQIAAPTTPAPAPGGTAPTASAPTQMGSGTPSPGGGGGGIDPMSMLSSVINIIRIG
ncbi:MAG TPA: hypothetical protein VLM79_35275 [Kofleriaceae bacterium]|nr:hypothetical protein [Kofleriaceae bacterium]